MTITRIEFRNCILDEVHVRNKVSGIDISSIRESWAIDTHLLARFINNLEAGNVNNEGLPIIKFAIKRRKLGELNSINIGFVPYDPSNKGMLEYIDYTAPAGDLIYSIVPIGENDLPGIASEVEIESVFTGVWLVDKKDNFTFGFNTQWGGELRALDIPLEQGRIELPSLSKYPNVYYTPEEFVRFTISALVVPNEYSFAEWKKLVNKISSHVPLIVKSGSGDLYVCDVYSPQKSTWLVNAYKSVDPVVFTVQCMELMDIVEYMEN